MRKLVYFVATSLDGYIAHEDGSIGGFLAEGDHIPAFYESLTRFDTVLMGRRTYEFGFQYGLKMGEPAYAEFGLRNVVFSNTMQFESSDQIQLVSGDPAPVVEQIKQGHGKEIWLCGGGAFAGTLLDCGLIDEVVVKLNPFTIGVGIPLFGASTRGVSLDLVESVTYSSGVLFLTYAVRYL